MAHRDKKLRRSEMMARVRSRDTKPELRLRRALWHRGMRYRLHRPTPGGRPDLVFASRRIAVFVDGCQWHGCPEHYVAPRSNREFWIVKLLDSVHRDRRSTLALEAAGWRVVRVWEHEVRSDLERVVTEIEAVWRGESAPTRPDWRVVEVEQLVPGGDVERRHLERLRCPSARRTIDGARITHRGR